MLVRTQNKGFNNISITCTFFWKELASCGDVEAEKPSQESIVLYQPEGVSTKGKSFLGVGR